MITLKGADVYSQLRKVTTGKYKSGPNKDEEYAVMSHGKRGFTIPIEVFRAWESGDLSEISLEEANYDREVTNPTTGEVEIVNTPSLTYSGSISNTQELKVVTHSARLDAVRAKVMKEYKLDAATLEATI